MFPARIELENGKWKKWSWKSAGSSTDKIGELQASRTRSGWTSRGHPDAIGVPTGSVNGICVVEADTKAGHGVDGIASLKNLEAVRGTIARHADGREPVGLTALLFQMIDGIQEFAIPVKIAPGVDVRGDGGMVIAPPSVMPGKGAYRWLNDLPDSRRAAVAD